MVLIDTNDRAKRELCALLYDPLMFEHFEYGRRLDCGGLNVS